MGIGTFFIIGDVMRMVATQKGAAGILIRLADKMEVKLHEVEYWLKVVNYFGLIGAGYTSIVGSKLSSNQIMELIEME